MDLNDRVAVVTGASGEIGARIAYRLAAAGANVVVTYVDNHEGALVTCRSVESLGRRTAAIRLDQTDPSSVAAAIEAAAGQWSRLDILVNNAAWNIGIPFPELDKLTTEIWDRVFNTNVRGPFQLARAAATHMRKQGGGRIVNIASVAGLRPGGSSIAYASSKAALVHLTRCLAVALAPDITVNCVAPGLIEGTRMAQRLPPAVVEGARQSVVLRRTSDMGDIARQVVTFCQADSVTGQVLVVDGGMHFH